MWEQHELFKYGIYTIRMQKLCRATRHKIIL
jgi:hypothetical protein